MNHSDCKPVHGFAKTIASHMPGFRYDAEASTGADGEPHWCPRITDGTVSLAFDARSYGKKAGHVTVRAWLPDRTAKGEYIGLGYKNGSQVTNPSINVNSARPANSIAADIGRRLLPITRELHAAQIKRIAEHDASDAAKGAALQRLLRFGSGIAYRENGFYVEFKGDGYGDGRVDGADSITLSLHSVPLELAERILTVIKGEP